MPDEVVGTCCCDPCGTLPDLCGAAPPPALRIRVQTTQSDPPDRYYANFDQTVDITLTTLSCCRQYDGGDTYYQSTSGGFDFGVRLAVSRYLDNPVGNPFGCLPAGLQWRLIPTYRVAGSGGPWVDGTPSNPFSTNYFQPTAITPPAPTCDGSGFVSEVWSYTGGEGFALSFPFTDPGILSTATLTAIP